MSCCVIYDEVVHEETTLILKIESEIIKPKIEP